MNDNIDFVLDTRGLYCPEPVMMLHKIIREMAEGDLLELIATDPSTQRDVTKFCVYLGHELVSQEQKDKEYYYYIRKGT